MHPILQFPDPNSQDLTGEFVQLRPLNTADTADLVKAGADEKIFNWFIDGWIILKHGMPTYIYHLLEERRQNISIPFTVYHRESRRAVGVTRLYNIEHRSRTAEIATWYEGNWHRTRVNTESKFLLLRYAFEVLNFIRVAFEIDERNEGSVSGTKRIGAVFEGKRRNDMILADGHIRHSLIFSITSSEWRGDKQPESSELSQNSEDLIDEGVKARLIKLLDKNYD